MKDNCRDTVAMLSDYAEDALSPSLTAEVEAHLHRCPRCREFLASIKALPRVVRELLDEAMPPDVERRVFARLGIRG